MKTNSLEQGKNAPLLPFVHLHTHTEYSLSDGLGKISELVDKAMADGMPGIAITDHANMFGVKEFVEYIERRNRELGTSFKPIIGCEVYVARRGKECKDMREDWGGHHLILLAKNATGYKNLVKIVSRASLVGFYGRPRTDKADLERYHEGLICCSACIGGEVAQHILNDRFDEAERVVKWYQNTFGEDYYLELQRHKATAQRANLQIYELEERVNRHLFQLSQKLGIKFICANDIHFVNEEDAEAHDTMLCVNYGGKAYDEDRLIFSKQEWLKTTAEMNELFGDIPEALANTIEVCNKVKHYSIDHAPMLPTPTLPEGVDEVEHLARLCFEGAHKRYGEHLSDEVVERLKQELRIINRKHYPAYFLLWHEIVSAARKMSIQVGVGRGSAGGSLVLYCLGITGVDPLRFGLSFEKFLKPESDALPNIDIDVDEGSRARLLDWIMKCYGEESVANIVAHRHISPTAAKRWVAQTYNKPINNLDEEHLQLAQRLEGVVNSSAIHACGVAICDGDISERVPLACISVPQYENAVIATQSCGEELRRAGVIVLNILSQKHLSIIKHFAERGVDIENILLDDAKTLELFHRGDTQGVVQFDSDEMRSLLQEVQPTDFEGLVEVFSHHCANRSHSVCYTLFAFQTAYLKAHYPAEYAERWAELD